MKLQIYVNEIFIQNSYDKFKKKNIALVAFWHK